MTTQKYSNGDHSHALDEFSIETPQDMMTHNHTATMNHPPSMDLEDYDTNSTATSDEFVTHGRSRCWYFTLAAIVVVLVAVGGGVGVAMSGKDSNDQNNEVAAAQSGNGFGSTKDASGSANGAGSSFSGNNDYATSNVQSSQQYPGASSAPTSEVFDIIMSYARYHGLEFQNPDSYQSKAKNWVEQTALPGVHSPERLVQRYALACLYYATNGVSNRYTDDLFGVGVIRGWIDESGWLDADDEVSKVKSTASSSSIPWWW